MTIETVIQKTTITEVGGVVVTDITQDEDTYVREIRVMSEADANGTKTLLFTLRLEAAAEAYIELNAPAQTF